LRGFNALAQERGETLAQMALRWVLQHQGVTSVIVGAKNQAQLADSLRCVHGAPLTAAELSLLNV
jgi:L-glyceraldehyde 3-phosphate reductase